MSSLQPQQQNRFTGGDSQHPAPPPTSQQQQQQQQQQNQVSEVNNISGSISAATGGGRFDFDDGGVYVGGWQDGKAHGHGICTGPKGQGEYSGSFNFGFEVCGVYKWPSGAIYEGQWLNGKRHGLGVEYRGKWVYKGEWTQGYKGRYGVRASLLSCAKYEGTWANGLQDGYGSETYADGGTYQGQWLRGMRHGYGVRQSAPYGHCNVTKQALIKNANNVSIQSLDTEGGTDSSVLDAQSGKRDSAMRGGFVLVVRNPSSHRRRNSLVEKSSNFKSSVLKGLRLKKQKSTGDIDVRSNRSSAASVASSTESSIASGKHLDGDADAISNASFLSQDGDISDPSTTETYMGEWKNDKRCGFGISERSDGLRYEGEWYNNKKYGYGVTFFRDGTREEGKYKNNYLVTNAKKKHLFVLRSAKLRERIESAVSAARQAQQIALQKADIAISRTATARGKAEQSDAVASQARVDSAIAYKIAKQYGGSDISALAQPEVPLRRRLSDFSQIRRGTRDNIVAQQGGPPGLGPGVMGSGSRQYLDPNEPFGGRRGSFRTPGPGGSGSGLGSGSNQPNYPYNNVTSSSSHPHPSHQSSLQFTASPGHGGHLPGSNQRLQSHQTSPSSYHHQQSPQQQQHYLQQQQQQQQHQQQQQQQQQQYQHQYRPGYYNEQDPLTDHLDHYQKLVTRYGKSGKPPLPDNAFNRFSRIPGSPSSSITSTISPTTSDRLISPGNRTTSQITASLDKAYGTDSGRGGSTESSSDSSGLKLPPVIDMSSDSSVSRTPLRTASLYRPPATNNVATGSSTSSGGGGGPLKRKPSLQPHLTKVIKEPVMSREEVSALSHATREQRRMEAEMAERLARNPLLYFVNPRFKDWLSRQQIIIAVLLINVTLAIIFFKLLG